MVSEKGTLSAVRGHICEQCGVVDPTTPLFPHAQPVSDVSVVTTFLFTTTPLVAL